VPVVVEAFSRSIALKCLGLTLVGPNPAFNRTRRHVAATSVTVSAARRLTSSC